MSISGAKYHISKAEDFGTWEGTQARATLAQAEALLTIAEALVAINSKLKEIMK